MTTTALMFHGMPPGPNEYKGANRAKTARDTKKWRQYAAALAQDAPHWPRVKIEATFFRRNMGVADEDNDRGRLKPIIDGLRDAGVIPNDTRKFVVWGRVTEAHGSPGVEVRISSLPPGCTRCGNTGDDVQLLTDDVYLCFVCYAKFVRSFLMTKHGFECVKDYIEAWKSRQ